MLNRHLATFLSSFVFSSASHGACYAHPQANIVDLGYAKHVPTWINTTSAGTELLNYNNIRYAEPPTGWKRFRKPVTPPLYQHGVQDGNRSSWETDCISSATPGVPFPLLDGNTWGSEDCLFLNVVVPKGTKEGDKLPVLHWVVGSAFAFGGKDWTGFNINTYGLFNRPLNMTDRFIIVTHNYRLGISGWLPKLDGDMNGNVGVWDTLAAIEWTKKYISKFGGDQEKITVIGQSAGAASLTWLLLAEEGNLTLPFEHAVISSPALAPRRTLERSRPVFDQILNATGCDDVQCMRNISESKLREANEYIFSLYPNGGGGALGPGVGLTPLVDGEMLSELPAAAFAHGKFNKQMKGLIVGNTADEGLGTASERDMPARFPVIVRANIPNVKNESIARLQSMYQYPSEQPEKLARDYTTDIIFGCSAASIASAYSKIARRYLFSIPPAYHGAEIAYFFFDNNNTTPVASLETAFAAQSYLLQYMFRENSHINLDVPYPGALDDWPFLDAKGTVANITMSGFQFTAEDGLIAARCAFINELLMDPENGV